MNNDLYLDDVCVGDVLIAGPYQTTQEEMVSFAESWNPRPEYLSGDIGCSEYVRAVKQRLISGLGIANSIIGAIGHERTRYPTPVRAGDAVTSRFEVIDLKPSRSKPDRGVCKFDVSILNQRGEQLMTYVDIVMMARRPQR